MDGQDVGSVPIYEYTVTVGGRPGPTALTFRALPKSSRVAWLDCPAGSKLRNATGTRRLVLVVPKPGRVGEFRFLAADEALAEARAGNLGLRVREE